MKQFFALVLITLCFSSLAHASTPSVSDLQISYEMDSQHNKPLRITKTITADTKRIFASVWVKEALADTQFSMKWYRYQGEESTEVLYQYDVKLKGTQFAYSAISLPDGHSFSAGEYFVDVILGGQVVASSSFEVLANPEKSLQKDDCIKPSNADDKRLVSDVLERYPTLKSQMAQLDLTRLLANRGKFSVILPKAWPMVKGKSSKTIISLQSQNSSYIHSKYNIKELPLKLLQRASTQSDDTSVVQTTMRLLLKLSLQQKIQTEQTLPSKIIQLPDFEVGRYEVLSHKEKPEWQRHTIIYDGENLYDFVIITEEENPATRGFLALLSVYSFWTQVSCEKQ